MRGTSKEKLYNELCPESLHLRRWYRKLGYFYKPETLKTYPFSKQNIFFEKKNHFFPPMLLNKTTALTIKLKMADTLVYFKKSILKFIRPTLL